MATAPLIVTQQRPGLFQRELPPRMIVATFPFLTVPLIVMAFYYAGDLYAEREPEILQGFLQEHALFFVVPLAILMWFYVTGVFQLNARFPAYAVVFYVIIRSLDFNHLNRQTYGVYQMFKARTGLRPPPSMKRLEQAYPACLTGLLPTTFLAGGIFPFQQVRGWPGIGGWATGRLLRALGYLGFHAAAVSLAVVNFPLYFATQPTHYVEYHVLMFPRCFNSQPDEKSALDRWFGSLRRNRAVFYGVIIASSFVVMALSMSSRSVSKPISYLAVVSIFDGLFVFHYLVEMLIWRFSEPFFRRTLGSFYFVARPQIGAPGMRATQ